MSDAVLPERVSIGISRRYMIFREIVVAFARVFLGLRVHGAERVPEKGAIVVASNHRRYLDPVYVCMAVPRRIQWMGKKELFVFPFSRLFYLIGCFPVDRQGGGRTALKAGLRYLELGAALGIFPEGTRRKDEGQQAPKSPKSGAVMLASRSGAPVLPVYVGPVPNISQRLRGERLEIYIGDTRSVWELDARNSKSYRDIAEGIVDEIHSLSVAGGES